MTPLPLTVIGGYLGAGKTTLINQVLTADHGLRLAVLVNDFGAINLDAALLQSASEDTIELTNGCVCCTMSGDLFFAIGDLLDRTPRPDHILVEASGIADPSKIAAVSIAEKDLCYSGIVTVVDGVNIEHQLADSRIAEQVQSQIRSADLVVVSKAEAAEVACRLRDVGVAHWTGASDLAAITAMIFGETHGEKRSDTDGYAHPAYVHWSEASPVGLSREALDARLARRPPGVLRMKALLPDTTGGFWEVHVVGAQTSISKRENVPSIGLVAIGFGEAGAPEEWRQWWQGKV